jgi:PAS domain S-box-containing protein
MNHAKILVVEDEQILAEDLRDILESFSYQVVDVVGSAEQAVKQARKLKPNLIMMDIMLGGKKDGIQAAQEIIKESCVPVVFLTAYADDTTVQRAKLAQPFGYLLKPFKEQEIHTTIQMALYKHQVDMEIRKEKKWLSSVLVSIGDAVLVADADGKVAFMNPAAEAMTGWKMKNALGLDCDQVLKLTDDQGGAAANPVKRALAEEDIIYTEEALLVSKRGRKTRVKDNAAPVRDKKGRVLGAVMIFRPASAGAN